MTTTFRTLRPRLVQHGMTPLVGGPVWTDFETDINSLPSPAQFSVSFAYLQTYDFDLRFDPIRGLPLDKPTFFSDADDGGFVVSFETTLTTAPISYVVQFYNLTSVPTWSVSVPPFSESDALIMLPNGGTDFGDFWTLNANGTTFDFSYPIPMNLLVGSRPAASVMNLFGQSAWSGRFGLLFVGANTVIVRDTAAYNRGFLAAQAVAFNTGWHNRPASRGRPVSDMRSGLPAFAQDLQEDGFHSGIWTSQANWDPDDPRNIRPVEFPDEEGVKDDDVPV